MPAAGGFVDTPAGRVIPLGDGIEDDGFVTLQIPYGPPGDQARQATPVTAPAHAALWHADPESLDLAIPFVTIWRARQRRDEDVPAALLAVAFGLGFALGLLACALAFGFALADLA